MLVSIFNTVIKTDREYLRHRATAQGYAWGDKESSSSEDLKKKGTNDNLKLL